MRNIWRIFRADWQRISASVVAVVVIMGLCLIPCLYAWFNIFSNWDPYGPDATSNIRVAVTSEDEGYELLGLKLNIGSMVLDGLKSNDQMGWDFVDSREEALEGVRSGKYYAALIVPADFTGDFVSILDTDLRHPQIEYYENEKKNAIAPKITNKAKTAVQDEINATVVETVTNAVTTVSSVCRALGLDADDVSQGVIEKLSSAQDSLRTLEETLTAMQTLADQTDSILACAGVVAGDLDSIVSGNDLSGIQDALDRGIGRLNETEAEIARQLEDIDAQIDVIADDIAAAVGTAEDVAGFLAGPAQQLDQRLAEVGGQRAALGRVEQVCGDLRQLCTAGPEQGQYDFAACNPPYFTAGPRSPDPRRAEARHTGSCTTADAVDCARRALRDGGRFLLCQRPEQLAEILAALRAARLEPKRLAFVKNRPDAAPWLFLVEAQKGRKTGLRVEPDILIQSGAALYGPNTL